MTIPELESRIASHQQDRLRLVAQVSAYDGAIQEATFWLEQLKAKQLEETTKADFKATLEKEIEAARSPQDIRKVIHNARNQNRKALTELESAATVYTPFASYPDIPATEPEQDA